jgi:hypothetical protein
MLLCSFLIYVFNKYNVVKSFDFMKLYFLSFLDKNKTVSKTPGYIKDFSTAWYLTN